MKREENMILLGEKEFVKGSSVVIIVPSLEVKLGTIDSIEVRTFSAQRPCDLR